MTKLPFGRRRTNASMARLLRSQMNNARRLAEVFGLVTAAAFLISAFFDALWMRVALGLSYFSVATPSDVLMGGVSSIGGAVLIGLISYGFTHGRSLHLRRRALNKALRNRRNPGSPAKLYISRLRDEIYVTTHPIMIVSMIVVVVVMAFFIKSVRPEMYYVSGADLPDVCTVSSVRWMGGQSAVVSCGGLNWIVRDGENVVFVRAKRECDVRNLLSGRGLCSRDRPDLSQLRSSNASAGSA